VTTTARGLTPDEELLLAELRARHAARTRARRGEQQARDRRGEPLEPLLRTAEVAQWLQVSQRTVLAWAASGRLPSITTPGGHHRFRAPDVERVRAVMWKDSQP
jgi:excisionase family DNA binding protein